MAEESFQEKTEPATPRKRQEARKEGKVCRSQETSSLVILMSGAVALFFFIPSGFARLTNLQKHLFSHAPSFSMSADSFTKFFTQILAQYAMVLLPIFITVAVMAAGISLLQVGPMLSTKAIEPKFERLNLAKGFKRLFSGRTLFHLARDFLKLAAIGLIGYLAITHEFKNVVPLADSEVGSILTFIGSAAFRVVLKLCLAFIVIAAADYAFQKYDYEKELRMSKQDVKDEMKKYEGSPDTKNRIRKLQREIANARMMGYVPDADVIVTNPTHIAVALKYDAEEMDAPTVVAKGKRLIADKIKAIAKENDVPVVENKPLARSLYEAVEVGMTVPANLYKAVAEVLAYVYRLKGKA